MNEVEINKDRVYEGQQLVGRSGRESPIVEKLNYSEMGQSSSCNSHKSSTKVDFLLHDEKSLSFVVIETKIKDRKSTCVNNQ